MDRFFGLDRAHPTDGNTALLTTVHDSVEEAVLCGILEGEGIPYHVRERGAGEVVRLVAGYSIYGSDILVPADLLEQAQALLDAYRRADADFSEDEIVVDPDGEEGETL